MLAQKGAECDYSEYVRFRHYLWTGIRVFEGWRLPLIEVGASEVDEKAKVIKRAFMIERVLNF
ncbi:MAG: hypothetical protein VR66_09985 [Peptococcaceae bacterium BRH_c23]|nr:MAG: hypothetical protein VR66_09985 [Peptococcaceae bacterium BRH_c23]KJS90664.1 MAG: hypothetical protein JL57_00615 [Desulfosporosinus sp. BICA1-9]HBW34952.1 hypothetical protein [Desulfosporosinus sp.]